MYASEPLITVVGNVAGPPRLRTTPAGVPVADFRIAATPRRHDRAAGTWSDGETLWFGVTAWRALGEHCAGSLKKGDRVVVQGRLTTRTWETEDGERRSSLEVDAGSVGLELTRAMATSVRPAQLVPDQDPWAVGGHDAGEAAPEAGERDAGQPDAGQSDLELDEQRHRVVAV